MKISNRVSPVLIIGAVITASALALAAVANMRNNSRRTLIIPVHSPSPAHLQDPYSGWHSTTDKRHGITIRYPSDWEMASDWLDSPVDSSTPNSSGLIIDATNGTNLDQTAIITVDTQEDEQKLYGLNGIKLSKTFPGLLTAYSLCPSTGGLGYKVTCYDLNSDEQFATSIGTQVLQGHKITFNTSIEQLKLSGSNIQSTSLVSPPAWIIPYTPSGSTKSLFVLINSGEQFASNKTAEQVIELIVKSIQITKSSAR